MILGGAVSEGSGWGLIWVILLVLAAMVVAAVVGLVLLITSFVGPRRRGRRIAGVVLLTPFVIMAGQFWLGNVVSEHRWNAEVDEQYVSLVFDVYVPGAWSDPDIVRYTSTYLADDIVTVRAVQSSLEYVEVDQGTPTLATLREVFPRCDALVALGVGPSDPTLPACEVVGTSALGTVVVARPGDQGQSAALYTVLDGTFMAIDTYNTSDVTAALHEFDAAFANATALTREQLLKLY